MGDKKKLLSEALETQFSDVSSGTDGQKKKESVETLDVLYKLALAQDKADQDAEFRESEMALKEREMDLKEAEQEAKIEKEKRELELKESQAEVEADHKERELAIKERELAIRKSELLMKKIEVAASIGIPVTGAVLYQKNFDKVYKFETETIQTVMAPKAAQYMRLMEKTLTNGVKSIFRR